MSDNKRNSDDAALSRHRDSQGAPTIGETSPEAAELKTRRIGNFEIMEVLGQGAFGAVYHAKDPLLEREVAIKVPHTSRIATQEMRQRFLREARAAAGLRHPNICPVYEIGEENDAPYIVMAFIKGQELSAVLKRRGHFTDRKAAILVRRIALGLEFAHQQGIVHRDLKPDNIMIDRERKEPVIMDFGLARRDSGNESKLTQEGQLMGTPVYMPPEQARGDIAQIGPASDIYSLGIILYELIAGCRPYGGSLAEVLSRVLTADAAPPSSHRADISPQLEAICLKAIEHDVENRYTSMLELAGDLAEFLKADGESLSASGEQPVVMAEASSESPALAETMLVPVDGDHSTSVLSDRRAFRETFVRHRTEFCAIAVVIFLAVLLATIGPWHENGGTGIAEPPVPEHPTYLVREFIGNGELMNRVRLSPDNQWIAASTKRGTILVWNREDSQPRMVNDSRKQIRMHVFSPDSQSLIIHAASSVFELSIPDGTENILVSYPKTKVTPSTSSRSQSGTVFVSRAQRDRLVEHKFVIEAWSDSEPDRSISVAVPGRLTQWGVLPESERFMATSRVSGEVCLWDFQDKLIEQGGRILLPAEALTILGQHASLATELVWSFDERVAATADVDGTVILWNIPDHKELRRLKQHPSTIHSLALSPDGRFLLTGCGVVARGATQPDELNDDYNIRLWDVETGSLIATVGSHKTTVTGLSFGGDSSEAVSCGNDHTVCLWKLPVESFSVQSSSNVELTVPDDAQSKPDD